MVENIQFDEKRAVEIGGGAQIDFEHSTYRDGSRKTVKLSLSEIRLLLSLTSTTTTVLPTVSRASLNRAYQRLTTGNDVGEASLSYTALPIQVSNLRKKLGKEVIQTCKNFGYRFTPPK